MRIITRNQFRHDFLRGLGSALLELKTCNNPQKYYDIVLYGCLHNTTFDMQSEGGRGWYLHEAAVAVNSATIENVIIERYSRSFSDIWLFDQLTTILYYFTIDGSKAARTALYDKYGVMIKKLSCVRISRNTSICNYRDMFDWLCVWLTSLDGWAAFKRIVNEVGEKLLTKDADFFFSEWFYGNAKYKFGEKRVKSYLTKNAENNGLIRQYWVKAQECDKNKFVTQSVPTLEEVIEGAGGDGYHGRGLSLRFSKNAGREDLEKLFNAGMAEPDLKKRAEILWGLKWAEYPVSDDFITEMLGSENEDIRETAYNIMENNPSPKAREYALDLINKGRDVANAIGLLSKNLIKSDERMFCDLVKSFPLKTDEGDWHSVFSSAIKGMKSIGGKPKTDLLEYMYRQTYCSYCRETTVKLMHKKKVLTGSLLQECRYDSNNKTRRLAETIIKRQNKIVSG